MDHNLVWFGCWTQLGQVVVSTDGPPSSPRISRRRREAQDEETWWDVEAGWGLGRQEFRQKMLELVGGKNRECLSGTLRLKRAEAQAARIIAEALNGLGWTEADWMARRIHKAVADPPSLRGRLIHINGWASTPKHRYANRFDDKSGPR